MKFISYIPMGLRPDFRKAETQALFIAIAIHLMALGLYGFSMGVSDEGVIVSKLKIRLGESLADAPKIIFTAPRPEAEYIIADESSTATEAVVESPIPLPEGTEKPDGQQIMRKARAINIPPELRSGSSYGNSGEGQIKAENYLELLGYLVQERAIVETPANLKGRAVLNLHIDRKGFVVKYRLRKGSGHAALDNAAVNFARKAMKEPLPPAPKSFDPGAKILKYDFTIYYD